MDIEYLLWLQGVREASGPVVRAFFSFLGSEAALVVLLCIPCFAYWCLDKRRGTLALFAYGTSGIFNQLLKNTVCCYRPWVRDLRVMPEPSALGEATGYSFPSGHSQGSASLLGGLGWAWRPKRWPLVAGLALTLLIAFSRNFLGVHAPQDVVVGLLVGLFFVLVAERLLDWGESRQGYDLRVVCASALVSAAFLVYATLKPYPLDYADGVLLVDPADMLADCYKMAGSCVGTFLGWYLERNFVRFSTTNVGRLESAARMVVGLALVLIALKPLGHLFVAALGPCAGELVRYLFAFVLAVAGVPMLFVPLSALVERASAAAARG